MFQKPNKKGYFMVGLKVKTYRKLAAMKKAGKKHSLNQVIQELLNPKKEAK